MKRRTYVKTVAAGAAAIQLAPQILQGKTAKKPYVRLGGPVFGEYSDPGQWVALVKQHGYRTVNSPVKPGVDAQEIKAYEAAAKKHDIVIAEVGAWSNTVSPNPDEAKAAMEKCV